MDLLQIFSTTLAVLTIPLALVCTICHLLKKFEPTRRKFADRPQYWVPLGFWSYVLIHYGLVYVWYGAWKMEVHKPRFKFDEIEKGMTRMISRSESLLDEMPPFTLPAPIFTINHNNLDDKVKEKLDLNSYHATFKAQTAINKKAVEVTDQFVQIFDTVIPDKCNGVKNVTKIELGNRLEDVVTSIKKMHNFAPEKEELDTLSNKFIDVFSSEKISLLGRMKIEKDLSLKKELLLHLKGDMAEIESMRLEIVKNFEKKTLDKFWLLRIFTFIEIFVTLAISMLAYVSFGRFDRVGIRGTIRLSSVSIPLSALNGLFVAAFIIWIGSLDCPEEVNTIGHAKFISKWKPATFETPMEICGPNINTLFAVHEVSHLIVKDDISNHIKDDYEQFLVKIENFKGNTEDLTKQIGELKNIVHKLKLIVKQECVEVSAASKISEYIDYLSKYIDEVEKVEKSIANWNDQVDAGKTMFETQFEDFVAETQLQLTAQMDKVVMIISSADLPCKTIEKKFEKGRQLMCQELNIPLNHHWFLLILLLVATWILLGLNVLVFRCVFLWNIERKKKENQEQSPEPTVEVVRRRRHRRNRRLDNHVF